MSQVSEALKAFQQEEASSSAQSKSFAEDVKSNGLADLKALDEKLTPQTFLFDNKLSIADISAYSALHPLISKLSSVEYYAIPSVTRYFNHLQSLPTIRDTIDSSPSLSNLFPFVQFDLDNFPKIERVVEAPKEKKPKPAPVAAETPVAAAKEIVEATPNAPAAATESVTTAAAQGQVPKGEKKAKKEKAPKAEGVEGAAPVKKGKAPPAPAAGPAPSDIQLVVGHILSVEKHPDADSLYVEQVDVGEAEPRTVVSGLVKYMTLEQMKGARITVVANMKPVAMRGIKSFAMVLCASSAAGKEAEGGGIEFVVPPPESKPGERIYFEGEKYENATPLEVLNPKKKVFETIQPGFTTLDTLEAAWIDKENGGSVHKIRTQHGYCKVASFVGASLS